LTVPGVGSSFRASETRPGIQKKYWIPAFADLMIEKSLFERCVVILVKESNPSREAGLRELRDFALRAAPPHVRALG